MVTALALVDRFVMCLIAAPTSKLSFAKFFITDTCDEYFLSAAQVERTDFPYSSVHSGPGEILKC